MLLINGISLRPEVGQHVMPASSFALVTQGGDIDRGNDDSFAWSRRSFGKESSVEIDNLTTAGP